MPDTDLPSESQRQPSPRTERDWEWWTDLMSALLLGLAAVASGWAAYQSSLWGGEQTFRPKCVERRCSKGCNSRNKVRPAPCH